MDQLIKKKQKKASTSTASTSMDNGKLTGSNEDPFEELNRWFKSKWLEREACPNAILWWGVSIPLVFSSSFYD